MEPVCGGCFLLPPFFCLRERLRSLPSPISGWLAFEVTDSTLAETCSHKGSYSESMLQLALAIQGPDLSRSPWPPLELGDSSPARKPTLENQLQLPRPGTFLPQPQIHRELQKISQAPALLASHFSNKRVPELSKATASGNRSPHSPIHPLGQHLRLS